jgi:hypothetical protein
LVLSASAQKPPKKRCTKTYRFWYTHIPQQTSHLPRVLLGAFLCWPIDTQWGCSRKLQLSWHLPAGSLDSVCCGLELFCACFAPVWKNSSTCRRYPTSLKDSAEHITLWTSQGHTQQLHCPTHHTIPTAQDTATPNRTKAAPTIRGRAINRNAALSDTLC